MREVFSSEFCVTSISVNNCFWIFWLLSWNCNTSIPQKIYGACGFRIFGGRPDPADIYLLPVDNQNNKTVSKLCSKLPIKILKRRHRRLMNNRLISYTCRKIQTPIVQNKYKQKKQTLPGNYDESSFPKKVNDISH